MSSPVRYWLENIAIMAGVLLAGCTLGILVAIWVS